MKFLTASLKSISPYSQSKNYEVEPKQGESMDDRYRRTWRNHMHFNEAGMIFIPPTAFKVCLSEAAKYLSLPIPGKGKATYTKNFEAGVLVAKPVLLGLNKDNIEYERLYLPSDGRRGGSKRVWKYYPMIQSWHGDVEFIIVDETVLQKSRTDETKTVFEIVLIGAGSFIGIGRFRPRNNGYYGRFEVGKIRITDASK
jgi:hypothetical protein